MAQYLFLKLLGLWEPLGNLMKQWTLLETDIRICKNGDVVPESSLRLICRPQISQMRSAYCQILFFVCGVGRCWWLGECCSSLQQVLNLGCESEAPGGSGRIGCNQSLQTLRHILLVNLAGKSYSPLPY